MQHAGMIRAEVGSSAVRPIAPKHAPARDVDMARSDEACRQTACDLDTSLSRRGQGSWLLPQCNKIRSCWTFPQNPLLTCTKHIVLSIIINVFALKTEGG